MAPRSDGSDRTRLPGGPLARLPLERKLPLLIGLLLLVVTGTFTWAAYQGVKQAVMLSGQQRLTSVTQQLQELLQRSARQIPDSARSFAQDPSLVAYLRSGSRETSAAARATLAERPVNQPRNLLRVELRSITGQLLLAAERRGPTIRLEPDGDILSGAARDSGAVGRIRTLSDTTVYPVMVPVTAGRARLGYLVQWRAITSTPESREQLTTLIGSGARLFLGNVDGGDWTDLSRPVSAPVSGMRADVDTAIHDANDNDVLVSTRAVAGSPWMVLLEFPSAAVLEPARNFLDQLLIIAAAVLLLGLGLTWVASHRISGPLRDLTAASRAISEGEYRHRVPVRRADELGVLAQSFNTMAARVEDARHGLEQKVRERTAELQERNAELEAYAYSISHDLRAPLRAMQGFSQALVDDYGERLDQTGRHFAERVVEAAKRMDALIHDLLAYSKISRADLPLAPVNLAQATRNALAQLEAEMAQRRANVIVLDPLPSVVANEAALVQAVANLIGNGIKFVPGDRTPRVEVRAEASNGSVRFSVQDNGIGIAPEHQARIFGVFERLHSTDEFPGTGIGLAIVRKGVERMSGRVGVESKPGEGSRFWIELPSADGAA